MSQFPKVVRYAAASILATVPSLSAFAQCAATGGTILTPTTLGCNVSTADSTLTITGAGTLNGWVQLTGNNTALVIQPGGAFTYDNTIAGSYVYAAIYANGADQNVSVTNNGQITVGNAAFTDTFEKDAIHVSRPLSFTLTNTGGIATNVNSTASNAIELEGIANGTATITNSGTIQARTGNGIGFAFAQVPYTVNVNNQTGGLISSTGNAAIASPDGYTWTVRNAGTISTGRGDAQAAITWANGADTLILEPTSVITGFVDAGAGNDTLALGGVGGSGTLDLSQVGGAGQYRNFEVFEKREGGTWTLKGTGAQPWSLYGGTLAVGSGATLNNAITNPASATDPVTLQALGTIAPASGDAVLISGAGNSQVTVESTGVVASTIHVNSPGSASITNRGTLGTAGGVAVLLESGNNNTLTLDTGTVLKGDVQSGTATGNAAILTGTGSASANFAGSGAGKGWGSITMRGTSWTLAGNETITGTAADALSVANGTLVLTGTATNGGGTTIANGATLQLGNNTPSGMVSGNVVDNGTLAFNRSDSLGYANVVSGTGRLTQAGPGTLTLTADNTYSGGTTISAGTLQLGDGGTTGSVVGDIANNGALVINRSNAVTLPGAISGTGTLTQAGTGTTTLSGASTYTGATAVNAGTLRVNGSIASPMTTVASGATLGGSGTIGGSVAVQNGGHFAPGNSPGTLTINGNLAFAPSSQLDYEFGQANVPGGPLNDLANVGGNLTLDGRLNVSAPAGGNFTGGVYRVINYAGALTDNGLDLGTVPAGLTPGVDLLVQTSVANQVNLVNKAGLGPLSFWDGSSSAQYNNAQVNGGSGAWRASASDAWTDSTGVANSSWQANGFAIFQATPGTVTVDNSAGAVSFGGAQFTVGGYVVNGAALTTSTADTQIRVGDGTSAGGAMTATIDSVIQGSGGLHKTDLGTLVLGGANTYTGGTRLSSGTVRVANDNALGAANGALDFDGGTLQLATAFDLASTRAVLLDQPGGTIDTNGFQSTLRQGISGAGGLTKAGAGTLVLAGANSYTGPTLVNAGTLQTGAAQNLAASAGVTVAPGATLFLNGFDQKLNTLGNSGLVRLAAAGAAPGTTLTVGSYSGGGTVALNTFIGADASASDKLVVNGGGASGPGTLAITRAGGAGDLTTGNGIAVVSTLAGGTTSANAFRLAGPVVAGPYEYTLNRGSRDTSAPDNWYLRSTVNCASPEAPGALCSPPTAAPVPNYRPEVSLYASIGSTALQYGRTLLDTLHERVGEESVLRGRADLAAQGGGRVQGGWARLIGMNGKQEGSPRGIYDGNPGYDYEFGGVQFGGDLWRSSENAQGRRDLAGLYGAVGYAKSDVDHVSGQRAGTNRFNGYTLGGYWTGYGPGDWYLDGVLQATWYDAKSESARSLPELKTTGWGIAGSLEGGYPFKLQGNWVVEPQAQVTAQQIDLGNGTDGAATVRFDDVHSLAGRLGVRVARTLALTSTPDDPNARLLTGWARASAWHEFSGNPTTSFSSATGFIPFRTDTGGGWWELKGGVTGEVARNTFVYGSVGYQRGFDGDRWAWDAKLGLRMHWQ
ncbi:MAG: autotransporter outer membrane beta-barrel domain-containing protein [Proteobacteria bacterium]|nr:autotransporter outer membrane beta-barrel domain-containing protein [Pseudomonadota bacterium]